MDQLTDLDVDRLWGLLTQRFLECGPRLAFRDQLSLLVATNTVTRELSDEQIVVKVVWILPRGEV